PHARHRCCYPSEEAAAAGVRADAAAGVRADAAAGVRADAAAGVRADAAAGVRADAAAGVRAGAAATVRLGMIAATAAPRRRPGIVLYRLDRCLDELWRRGWRGYADHLYLRDYFSHDLGLAHCDR